MSQIVIFKWSRESKGGSNVRDGRAGAGVQLQHRRIDAQRRMTIRTSLSDTSPRWPCLAWQSRDERPAFRRRGRNGS
ncbi:hypothetical protein [Burkholderia sp. 22313]|uniref:hypothetical protein n=1 Tax=Burkholderia sp. 22313 TaxID=3453908 RepID=UPI003F82E10B